MRKLSLALIAALVGTFFGATAGAVGAGATTPKLTDCRSVTTTVHRPDHGHGTTNGGYWANMHLTRTTTFCVVPVPDRAEVQKDAEVTLVAPPAKALYLVTVTEVGTLTTIAGANLSPNDGKNLAVVSGAVAGGWWQLLVADAGWLGYEGNYNGATLSGQTWTDNKGSWAAAVWGGDDAKVSPIKKYGWTYQTCVPKIVKSGYVEQWVDSSAPSNNDGQSNSAGDIVGLPCPSASPSASAPTSPAPSLPAPSSSNVGVSLPVTGSPIPGIAITGVVLLTGGAVLFVLAHRRRTRTEFTA